MRADRIKTGEPDEPNYERYLKLSLKLAFRMDAGIYRITDNNGKLIINRTIVFPNDLLTDNDLIPLKMPVDTVACCKMTTLGEPPYSLFIFTKAIFLKNPIFLYLDNLDEKAIKIIRDFFEYEKPATSIIDLPFETMNSFREVCESKMRERDIGLEIAKLPI